MSSWLIKKVESAKIHIWYEFSKSTKKIFGPQQEYMFNVYHVHTFITGSVQMWLMIIILYNQKYCGDLNLEDWQFGKLTTNLKSTYFVLLFLRCALCKYHELCKHGYKTPNYRLPISLSYLKLYQYTWLYGVYTSSIYTI